MGTLQSFTIAPDGKLIGVFSNGLQQALGQVALATFNNPPGLEKVGGSMYRGTVNSGYAADRRGRQRRPRPAGRRRAGDVATSTSPRSSPT